MAWKTNYLVAPLAVPNQDDRTIVGNKFPWIRLIPLVTHALRYDLDNYPLDVMYIWRVAYNGGDQSCPDGLSSLCVLLSKVLSDDHAWGHFAH